MQKTLAFLLIFSMISVQVFASAGSPPSAAQDYQDQVLFSPEQLENLVAPIALYPDPLLAQVLLAATFPDQIDEAARIMRAYNNNYNIDATNWDVSVKAVAHYPTVLSMMADKIDWTTSLGQAYVNQSTDVMDAVQRLRRQARSVGNLVTTPQHEIVETGGYIYIYPAQPQYIYVPSYDPAVVYFRRGGFFPGPVIWFSIGFVIGAWLNHDCDWDHHRVFYHGWEQGPVWAMRARPYIRVNNIYVNPRYQNVIVNRTVLDHRVNYGALNRYHAIHRDTDFNNVRRRPGVIGERRTPPGPAQTYPDNKIIRRNIDRNDARIDANRGRGQLPQAPPQAPAQTRLPRPETRAPHTPIQGPVTQAPPPQGRTETRSPRTPIQGPVAAPTRQPEARMGRPEFSRTQPPSAPAQPRVQTPPAPQPRTQAPPTGQVPRPQGSVFRGSQGTIDTRDASRRGQTSREHEYRSAPSARTAPQPRAQNLPPGQQRQSGRPQDRRPR